MLCCAVGKLKSQASRMNAGPFLWISPLRALFWVHQYEKLVFSGLAEFKMSPILRLFLQGLVSKFQIGFRGVAFTSLHKTLK